MWASGYHMWCNFGAHMRNEGSNPATILFATSAQIISNNPKVNKSQSKSKNKLYLSNYFSTSLKGSLEKRSCGLVARTRFRLDEPWCSYRKHRFECRQTYLTFARLCLSFHCP